MKRLLTLAVAAGIAGLAGCAGISGAAVASSGRSGCNNIDMAEADMRNDPANGLMPVPAH